MYQEHYAYSSCIDARLLIKNKYAQCHAMLCMLMYVMRCGVVCHDMYGTAHFSSFSFLTANALNAQTRFS